MKKMLLVLSAAIMISCGGSKTVVQNSQQTVSTKETFTTTDSLKIKQIAETIKDSIPQNNIEEVNIEEVKIEKTVDKAVTKPQLTKEDSTKIKEHTTPSKKNFDHSVWDDLLKKYVVKGGSVNYKGLKQNSTTLRIYLKSLENHIPDSSWSKEEKLAFWMNVYNAYTVKIIIDNYPIKSIKDIKAPWDYRFIKIGKKWYTLNDVEHKILRKMGEPRIHFGINCASFSCPPLLNKAFTPKNVNDELDKLAVTFINDTKRNTITTNKIEISKLFSWFGKDFKTQGSLIDFLNKYSKITISPNALKSYKKYNWNLNE